MKRMKSAVKACSENKSVNKTLKHQSHIIDQESRTLLRQGLLNWYDKEKRALQWREMAQHEDPNIRAYSGTIFIVLERVIIANPNSLTLSSFYFSVSVWNHASANTSCHCQALLCKVDEEMARCCSSVQSYAWRSQHFVVRAWLLF